MDTAPCYSYGMRTLLIVAAAALVFAAFLFTHSASSASVQVGGAQPRDYAYPSPSGWTTTPYPDGSPVAEPTTIVAPCPAGEVPTTATWRGKTVPACTVPGGVPPDPGGPLCAGVNGGAPFPPVKEPDGSYDCGQGSEG